MKRVTGFLATAGMVAALALVGGAANAGGFGGHAHGGVAKGFANAYAGASGVVKLGTKGKACGCIGLVGIKNTSTQANTSWIKPNSTGSMSGSQNTIVGGWLGTSGLSIRSTSAAEGSSGIMFKAGHFHRY